MAVRIELVPIGPESQLFVVRLQQNDEVNELAPLSEAVAQVGGGDEGCDADRSRSPAVPPLCLFPPCTTMGSLPPFPPVPSHLCLAHAAHC